MANDFSKNFTQKVLKKVVAPFEHSRVISRTINTQMLDGHFDQDSGGVVRFKRQTDAKSIKSLDGDVSAHDDDSYITGTALGEVKGYITVKRSVSEAVQALEFGSDHSRFWDDIGHRLASDFDDEISKLVGQNTGLLQGNPGNGITGWTDIARTHALMTSTGIPSAGPGGWNYILNPYSQIVLADDQRTTLNQGQGLITKAHQEAMVGRYGGMDVLSSNILPSYTTSSIAGRSGTLSAAPDATYVSAKDTMTQTYAVTGFGANLVIKAGEQIRLPATNRLNLATRKLFVDQAQTAVPYTATVTEEVALDGAGAGMITVTGPALFEANGAYNTVDSAPQNGDTIQLLGAADTFIQPNVFYHRDAFSVASVPMETLSATQSFARTADGIELRVTQYSDADRNKNKIRFDLRYAFAVLNPFYAGVGYGE